MRTVVVTSLLFFSAVSGRAADTPQVLCQALGGYRECRIATSGTPHIVRELSEPGECVEAISWGKAYEGVVWVNRNCAAVFTIPERRPSLENSSLERVVCESTDSTRTYCRAESNDGVTLARQLSRTACIEVATWGYNAVRKQIWVADGCRAEFILGKPREPLAPVEALTTVVLCESADGRRRECPANTSAGAQIVRQLSAAKCGFGKEWGYDETSLWVTKGCRAEFAVKAPAKPAVKSITCESAADATNRCDAETTFGVALVRQLGTTECKLDENWGFDGRGVWVSNGCNAQFALGGYRLPAAAVPATAARLRCESSGDRHFCPAAASRGVGLINQTSEAPCVLNRTWGYDATGIWVSGGCGAEFAVAK